VSDQDQDQNKAKATAVLSLPEAPSERAKAIARLLQAALCFSASSLQQGACGYAALADINDLSFRRDEGKVDFSAALFGGTTLETAYALLLEAAIAFAEADTVERTANPDAAAQDPL
jgi:hypothetical protein